MSRVLAIAGKELRSYFVSPVAYVITAAFLVITGYLFSLELAFSQDASMRGVFGNMAVTLLLVSPVLTMRLLAEEQRSGTIELLMTTPVRDVEVVIGKYLGSLGLLTGMLALTLYYPFILVVFGQPDFGPIMSGYLGVYLIGATFLAVGLLTSSVTQNQIVSAVVGFVVLLVLWLIGFSATIAEPPISDFLRYVSIPDRFDDFMRGVIDSRSIIFQLSLIALPLFVATKVLEVRRWR